MSIGGVDKRTRHCVPCNVNVVNKHLSKHEKTKRHKEMLRGGLQYERCPLCEESLLRTGGKSRISGHLKRCRVKKEDFYKRRGQFYVCTELMKLLSRDIPEAEVMKARKEREALLDKFPSEDQTDSEDMLNRTAANLSKKELLAKVEEMLALDTSQSFEEVVAQVEEWKRNVLEQAQVSKKKRSSDASEGQESFTAYITFAHGEDPLEDPYIGKTTNMKQRKSEHALTRNNSVMEPVVRVRSANELSCAEHTLWSLFGDPRNEATPPYKPLFKKLASDEVVREDSARLRYLFAVEMVFNLRKKYQDSCRL